jgi:hypothetical protein
MVVAQPGPDPSTPRACTSTLVTFSSIWSEAGMVWSLSGLVAVILKALVDGLVDSRVVGVAGDSLDAHDQTLEVAGAVHCSLLILL